MFRVTRTKVNLLGLTKHGVAWHYLPRGSLKMCCLLSQQGFCGEPCKGEVAQLSGAGSCIVQGGDQSVFGG